MNLKMFTDMTNKACDCTRN